MRDRCRPPCGPCAACSADSTVSAGPTTRGNYRADGKRQRAARRRGPRARGWSAPSSASPSCTRGWRNLRREQAHQLTTALVREFGVIGVETLAVKNLIGNRRLARHIADVGWGIVLSQLAYKTSWSRRQLRCPPPTVSTPPRRRAQHAEQRKPSCAWPSASSPATTDSLWARSGPRPQRGPEPRAYGAPPRAGGGHRRRTWPAPDGSRKLRAEGRSAWSVSTSTAR